MHASWSSTLARLCAVAAFANALPTYAQGSAGPVPGDPQAARLEQMARIEREDFGVAPTQRLHDGAMHGPTPASIPGGQVITTQGLFALIGQPQLPARLVDTLGQQASLPNAVTATWLANPGSFDDEVQQQAVRWLAGLTQSRKDVPLVFFCQSRECWLSYNAALRAIRAGYTNVLWYRGGIQAWTAAGLPMQPAGAPGTSVAAGAPGGPGTAAMAPPTAPVAPGMSGMPGMPGAGPARAHENDRGTPPGDRMSAPAELAIGRGRFFTFALPPGWRIGEDGQFALTRVAPDASAMTVMVGNAGLPLNQSPAQYAHARLSSMRPRGLQLGAPRPAQPIAGFSQAVAFDVRYWNDAGEHLGLAKVSMAPGYDSTVMAMTASLSSAAHWPGYATWLPLVADQIAATDGAAFGRRGIMQQNLRNSVAFGEAAREFRDWSQRNWQSVTDQRNSSVDRRNFQFRENIGAVQTYANPFGAGPPIEMPSTHRYYWLDRQGRTFGTDDPGVNPNAGSTGDWRRMERVAQ